MADPVAPSGKLDLTAATALQREFTERSGQDVLLDFEQVTSLGALCLQLCIAAAREARSAGNSFEIINVTEPVAVHMESMGFTAASLAEGAA